MMNQAQEAYDLYDGGPALLDGAPERSPRDYQEPSPFVVHEGGHLDADARKGVSPEFMRRVGIVVIAILVVFAVGCVRVALTVGTINLMQSNSALEESVSEAQATNTELRIERSLLSSKDRIARIATQNLGMVYSKDSETITVD